MSPHVPLTLPLTQVNCHLFSDVSWDLHLLMPTPFIILTTDIKAVVVLKTVLILQEKWVQSLIRELRSHMLHSMAKEKEMKKAYVLLSASFVSFLFLFVVCLIWLLIEI